MMQDNAAIPKDCAFGLWVSVLYRSAHVYFSKILKPYSLGPGQQAYLLAIYPGEIITQETLARRLLVDKANVARAVGALAGLGYVERVLSEADARERLVRLTEDGRKVRNEVESYASAWVNELKQAAGDDTWQVFEKELEHIAKHAAEYARSISAPY